MALVKLDATTSTNDFLKELARDPATENFTVVTAESQSAGRGQMGASWVSEHGKNLMMSVLVKEMTIDADRLFALNVAVALAVAEVLEQHDIRDVRIKWPNDIMSGNKKLAGILIENSFRTGGEIQSIVGIGLNVNQSNFGSLPKAGSMFTAAGKTFDKEAIRDAVVEKLIRNTHFIAEHEDVLWESYRSRLFKRNVPTAFENLDGNRFMGIIRNVTADGKLAIELEGDSVKNYALKEIQMLY